MRRFYHITLASLMLTMVGAASCDRSKTENLIGDTYYNMVTYQGYESASSLFTYQADGDSPLITLEAQGIRDTTLTQGKRMLLYYVITDGSAITATHQKIAVKSHSSVLTDTVKLRTSVALSTLKCEAVRLQSIWRSGNWINIRLQLEYTGQKRLFYLATTGQPDANGIVKCQLAHNMLGATPRYWMSTYVSYYVGGLLSKSGCKGVKVALTDLNYPKVGEYTFLKQ